MAHIRDTNVVSRMESLHVDEARDVASRRRISSPRKRYNPPARSATKIVGKRDDQRSARYHANVLWSVVRCSVCWKEPTLSALLFFLRPLLTALSTPTEKREREREKELPSSHGVKWYVPVSNGGPTIRGQIRRDGTMGYNGTMGLTLCFLSLLTSATERQEETNASGTLIVLTCRFGLFESAGVVAFRNSLYGPRYGHVSRRYGAVAIPWLSCRKRRDRIR